MFTLFGLKMEDTIVERFRTMLMIASGIINQRPITKVSSDANDFQALTPSGPSGYPHVMSTQILPDVPIGGSMLRRSHDDL